MSTQITFLIAKDLQPIDQSLLRQTSTPFVSALVVTETDSATARTDAIRNTDVAVIGTSDPNRNIWLENGEAQYIEGGLPAGTIVLQAGAELIHVDTLAEVQPGRVYIDRSTAGRYVVYLYNAEPRRVLTPSLDIRWTPQGISYSQDEVIDFPSIETDISSIARRATSFSVRYSRGEEEDVLHHEQTGGRGFDAIGNHCIILEGSDLLQTGIISEVQASSRNLTFSVDNSAYIDRVRTTASVTNSRKTAIDHLTELYALTATPTVDFSTLSTTIGLADTRFTSLVSLSYQVGDDIYGLIQSLLDEIHCFAVQTGFSTVSIRALYTYETTDILSRSSFAITSGSFTFQAQHISQSQYRALRISVSSRDIYRQAQFTYKNAQGEDGDLSAPVDPPFDYDYNEIENTLEYNSLFVDSAPARSSAIRKLCDSLSAKIEFETTQAVDVGDVLAVEHAGFYHLVRAESVSRSFLTPFAYKISGSCHTLLIGAENLRISV